MSEGVVEFIYNESTRRPKRLQNNVFVLNALEKIRLQPGKVKNIKMKIKVRLLSGLVGCCTLLPTLSDNRIKLLNLQHISSESNTVSLNQPVDLPWFLTLEVFNRNLNSIFQLRKVQEVGYFHILNDRGEEIRHVYKKEQ